jgi:hypothetical protein
VWPQEAFERILRAYFCAMFDVTAASNSVIEEGKKKLYEVQVE